MANERTVQSSSIELLTGLTTLGTYFCIIYYSFVHIFVTALIPLSQMLAARGLLQIKYFAGMFTLRNYVAQQKRICGVNNAEY